MRLAEHVTKWFNKKPSGRTVAIFIDVEKAFDSVWHEGLKKLFHDAKFPIKIIRWVSSFLDNRKGAIRINNIISREFILKAGVPQGSLLAPILYIFYIKNIPTKVFDALITSFYADDCSYAASDTLHKRSKNFASDYLQHLRT